MYGLTPEESTHVRVAIAYTSWPQLAHVCGVADGYVRMYADSYD